MNSLETEVLYMIGENVSSPDVFTDSSAGLLQIRDSLNDAVEEIALVTGAVKAEYQLPLTASTTFYRLDFSRGELMWITDVWLHGQNRRLEQVDLIRLVTGNPRWLENTGNPEAYFPVGFDYLGVWPTPSATTDLLKITAAIAPERYTYDNNRIDLRTNWKWAAVHFAVGEYFASRGDAKRAIYHHNEYLKNVGLNVKYPYATEYVQRLYTNKYAAPGAPEAAS